MEFRLVYQGRLPSAASDNTAKTKQTIRNVFHPQLKELWHTHPRLAMANVNQHMIDQHLTNILGEFRFMPLVNSYFGLTCRIDILFLRRDMPGNLIKHGGDIDNRLKVLFDALRMPTSTDELAGAIPTEDNRNPFHCLLEDDKLVTQFSVITDRLLTPKQGNEGQNDVHLVMHVTTIPLSTPTI